MATDVHHLLDWTFYGNTAPVWVEAFGFTVGALFSLLIIKKVVALRLWNFAKKTETEWDDMFAELLSETQLFFFFALSVYIGAQVLVLPKAALHLLHALPILALLMQCGVWGRIVIDFSLRRYMLSRGSEEERQSIQTMQGPLKFVGLVILWSVLILFALDNIGVDITALVASLGVGGVAIALAVQNVLGDLFAAMSIVLDKPFIIGDFIIIDDYMGNVEHIGLKTTRVRSISGEQLVFSNSDLLQSRIKNYKRMNERRVVFSFGVVYQTTYEQLEKIPGIVQSIVESLDQVRFDRAHFSSYGASSLDFEVVYYVLDQDYLTYMNLQQSINLALFKRFEEEGLVFAYPTQTLYLANETDTLSVKTSSAS